MLRTTGRLNPVSTMGLILLLTAAFLAGCGGGEPIEQATPTSGANVRTTGQPAPALTPTDPPSMPATGEPTANPESDSDPSPTATPNPEFSSEVQTYLYECDLEDDIVPATYGEAAKMLREFLEKLRNIYVPDELREFNNALLAINQRALEYIEQKDANDPFDLSGEYAEFTAFTGPARSDVLDERGKHAGSLRFALSSCSY